MDPSVSITAVITHRVLPGREGGYDQWLQGIAADARNCTGYLGAHILRPELGMSSDHVIVAQFETCQQLDAWMQSETRRAWVDRFVGTIHDLETSLYFSGITFTTVEYGDLTLAKCRQLLNVGEALNGVLMAGWSTALLILMVQRMMTFHMQMPGALPDADVRP